MGRVPKENRPLYPDRDIAWNHVQIKERWLDAADDILQTYFVKQDQTLLKPIIKLQYDSFLSWKTMGSVLSVFSKVKNKDTIESLNKIDHWFYDEDVNEFEEKLLDSFSYLGGKSEISSNYEARLIFDYLGPLSHKGILKDYQEFVPRLDLAAATANNKNKDNKQLKDVPEYLLNDYRKIFLLEHRIRLVSKILDYANPEDMFLDHPNLFTISWKDRPKIRDEIGSEDEMEIHNEIAKLKKEKEVMEKFEKFRSKRSGRLKKVQV